MTATRTEKGAMNERPRVVEIDVQCARCGSSMGRDDCHVCGGEGEYEVDGDWDMERCPECAGTGGWWSCLSSGAWCEAHPRPGREGVTRHTEEWFEVLDDGTTRLSPAPSVSGGADNRTNP